MNNLTQPIQKPKNYLKLILTILAIIVIIFVLFFVSKVFQVSKEINQLHIEEKTKDLNLKHYLQTNYSGELKKIIEGENNYSLGSDHPQVTIVEFADFACPHCKESYPIIRNLVAKYPEDIKIIFRDRPAYDNSLELALSAYCAGEQGKFWAMHDKLYQYQSLTLGKNIDDLIVLGKQIGLEENQFKNCISTKKYLEQIKSNFLSAQSFGVNGTPTWYVNGEKIEGTISQADWEKIINKIIK